MGKLAREEFILSINYAKYLSKRPLNAFPCLASTQDSNLLCWDFKGLNGQRSHFPRISLEFLSFKRVEIKS